MPFIRIPGFPGKLYIPERQESGARKHDCPDCSRCQMCSDTRCSLCRKERPEGTRRFHDEERPAALR